MAAHAIAHALDKKVIFVDYAEIESKYVGETAKNIKRLFQSAEELGAIIVFDEADALLSKRVTDMRSSSDVSVNQTRSVLLNILNEYSGVVIFTTNFIQNFDPAFLRRIRYQIKFHLPNASLRKQLWEMYIPAKMPTDADPAQLAEKYENVSGSDIANAVFSASVKAARMDRRVVEQKFFEDAIGAILRAKMDNGVVPGRREAQVLTNDVRNRTE
jgi:ATP-dependent 26S proteasome regulatory subunit